MKEYPDKTDMQSGQVKEPLSTYSSPYQGGKEKSVVSGGLLDDLLHQSNDVKLLIIQKLSESMMTSHVEEEEISMKARPDARREEIEAKLNELHVTGSLRHLVGAIPQITDEEMETAKATYFKEKFGL